MPDTPELKLDVIPIPPKNSFTNWPDFNRAEIEPISKILLNKEDESSFNRAYGIISNADKTIWTNNIESKLLYQLFKNPSVAFVDIHKKAKGEAKINSFSSM